jgi:ABC-type transport system involved in cytochrome c biogenesis permease component
MIGALLKRDVSVLISQRAEIVQLWAMPLLYAFLVGFLDPMESMPLDVVTVLLFVWPVQILSSRMWQDDVQSGIAEQFLMSHTSLSMVALVRILVMAFGIVLPAALGVAAIYAISGRMVLFTLQFMALAMAAPVCAALASMVAGLTVSLRGQAALALLLLFPGLWPILILLAAALSNGENAVAACYLLAACSIAALPLGAWGTAAALKQQLSS